jgi:hypothetical protein
MAGFHGGHRRRRGFYNVKPTLWLTWPSAIAVNSFAVASSLRACCNRAAQSFRPSCWPGNRGPRAHLVVFGGSGRLRDEGDIGNRSEAVICVTNGIGHVIADTTGLCATKRALLRATLGWVCDAKTNRAWRKSKAAGPVHAGCGPACAI